MVSQSCSRTCLSSHKSLCSQCTSTHRVPQINDLIAAFAFCPCCSFWSSLPIYKIKQPPTALQSILLGTLLYSSSPSSIPCPGVPGAPAGWCRAAPCPGPRSAINSVIFTNRWEFMCIFKLCSVSTPHWQIGHGARVRPANRRRGRRPIPGRPGTICAPRRPATLVMPAAGCYAVVGLRSMLLLCWGSQHLQN